MAEPIRINMKLCAETTYRRPIDLQLEMETTVDIAADGVESLAQILASTLARLLAKPNLDSCSDPEEPQ